MCILGVLTHQSVFPLNLIRIRLPVFFFKDNQLEEMEIGVFK